VPNVSAQQSSQIASQPRCSRHAIRPPRHKSSGNVSGQHRKPLAIEYVSTAASAAVAPKRTGALGDSAIHAHAVVHTIGSSTTIWIPSSQFSYWSGVNQRAFAATSSQGPAVPGPKPVARASRHRFSAQSNAIAQITNISVRTFHPDSHPSPNITSRGNSIRCSLCSA
jgi:hypothetical protein